ncbi:DUF6625 family protein [Enterococcus olivae]
MNDENSIVLILPYFGNFPNYFNLWIKTAEYNETIDFMIITDNPSQVKSKKENIKVIEMTFYDLQQKIYRLLGNNVRIDDPYKLCEYKPAFGEIFNDLIIGYTHWGFCDPDLIWGNIRSFLTNEVLNNHDRMYFLGHLTIYKNSEYINSLYRSYNRRQLPNNVLDYELAFSTKYVKQFSEMAGTSAWYPHVGVKTYSKIDFADVDFRKYDFYSTFLDKNESERYFWKEGKAYRVFSNGIMKEVIYIHLQKRNMKFSEDFLINTDKFFIKPNMFSLKKDSSFWCIDKKIAEEYEDNVREKEKKKKLKRICSIDFIIYYIKLKLFGKKIPKIPSKVFYPKYYK